VERQQAGVLLRGGQPDRLVESAPGVRPDRQAGRAEQRVPYLARHTPASLLLDNGATVEEVADLLGDNACTIHLHHRHKVQLVAAAGTRMAELLAADGEASRRKLRARSAHARFFRWPARTGNPA
jgi:hypothetical protein